MIITCPNCAARYDVDDDRFTPNGRSVRCTACGESWYVPAPEPLDIEPVEELKPAQRAKDKGEWTEETQKSSRAASRLKVKAIEEDDAEADPDEDSLFDDPSPSGVGDDPPRDARGRFVPRKKQALKEEPVEKGWRKGKQFIVEDEEAEEARRPFFKRAKKKREEEFREEEASERRSALREALRFGDSADDEDAAVDERDADASGYNGRRRPGRRARNDLDDLDGDDFDLDNERFSDDDYDARAMEREAAIVDADWEDVDESGARARGFGRRIRAERRRATAVARVEDVRPFNSDYFDDEFFASLRVTPKELERALRKARRRAEAREKNRMTPLRAFGWTAWVLMVAGVLYGVFAYRNDIVRIAPQTADAYAVIGIDANPYGLAIDNVRHRLAMSTAGPTIEITGSLRNDSDAPAAAPLLQAEALGPRGELLSRWTFTASEEAVEEGQSVDFVTRAPAPEGVAEVALSFAPPQSVVTEIFSDRE